jgi:hypothetical protein
VPAPQQNCLSRKKINSLLRCSFSVSSSRRLKNSRNLKQIKVRTAVRIKGTNKSVKSNSEKYAGKGRPAFLEYNSLIGGIATVMNFKFTEKIGALSPQQRIYFYELFAHFITVQMRGVLFTEGIADSERVECAKWLNEIAHRITYKIFFMSRKPEVKWTDEEIREMIEMNIEKHPAIETDVDAAVELSYGYVLENESESV